MSSKVFLSYRRDDARWTAIVMQQALEAALGEASVFRDISGIKPGTNWRETLQSALDVCEVTLVLIGPSWMEMADRLHSDSDMVRMEIANSLDRGIPVVPVLVDGTALPDVDDLPDDVSELVDRQAAEIGHRTYKSDIEDIVARLNLRGRNAAQVPDPGSGQAAGTLRDGLKRFLSRFDQWAFSAARIANWGASQQGFEYLSAYDSNEIRAELQKMVDDGVAETRLSKKGGTLYRLAR